MKELWKDIIGYKGYYKISNMGRVKSLKRKVLNRSNIRMTLKERILKPGFRNNYLFVTLHKNSKKSSYSIHRLVLQAFIGNSKEKFQANHKNGIKSDNRIENLEWVSPSQNIKHGFRIGLSNQKGILNNSAKLSKETIFFIRKIGSNMRRIELAKMFGISQGHVSEIINRNTWKHI